MNIVVDGQERYVVSNDDKICRARRAIIREFNQKYKSSLREASFLQRYYLKYKRWLELRRRLAQLETDLSRQLYLTAQ